MNIYYSPKHFLHATDQLDVKPSGHRYTSMELPDRAISILNALETEQLGAVVEPSDFGIDPLGSVHDTEFLDFLKTIYQKNLDYTGKPNPVFPNTFPTRSIHYLSKHPDSLVGYYCFDVDSPIMAGTWEAAYWSAQCALSGAQDLISNPSNPKCPVVSYALCRPPGHHASRDTYGGYCYLNNAAIAACYLGRPVAILDIDYHHGNGTQEIFYSDAEVLFCSIHVDPEQDYPYFWGSSNERGESAGSGYNFNWPLPIGTQDHTYLSTLDQALAVIAGFAPKYLIVSAGFDILSGDPIGGFQISLDGISQIAKAIAELNLPTLIIQEGGYQLPMLGKCAVQFLCPFIK